MLWAIHLSDGILQPGWQLLGFLGAGLLVLAGAWRLREEEIAPTALLGAVFFVASLIHVRLGPSSVHLLLNGLLGVLLGRRAGLAIVNGLFLQAALLAHGGFGPLGMTTCVMVLPAFLAGGLFRWLHGRHSSLLIGVSVLLGGIGVVYSVALLATNPPGLSLELDTGPATRILLHPATLLGLGLTALLGVHVGRRQQASSEFALGLLLGQLTVLLTLLLQATVLVLCGEARWHSLGVVLFVAHLPIAAIEGIVLGFAVGFLARVKPELLGLTVPVSTSGEMTCSELPATCPAASVSAE